MNENLGEVSLLFSPNALPRRFILVHSETVSTKDYKLINYIE